MLNKLLSTRNLIIIYLVIIIICVILLIMLFVYAFTAEKPQKPPQDVEAITSLDVPLFKRLR